MLKLLKKFFQTQMVAYTYNRYSFSITLVNGEVINIKNDFYTTFKWESYVTLDIFGVNNLKIGEELYNTKNILKVVLNDTEKIEREFSESDWNRPRYIHDEK